MADSTMDTKIDVLGIPFGALRIKHTEELKVIQKMRMNGTLSEGEYEKLRSRIFDGLNPKSVESEKSVFNIINN